MARILEYKLNSLALPASSPLLREFHTRKTHISGDPELGEADYEGFDRTTIFYDLTLDRTARELVAFCPPLVNLEQVLLPATFEARRSSSDGWQRLSLRRHKRVKHELWQLPLPRSWRGAESLEVRVRFADGTGGEFVARRSGLRHVFQQWSTLQKDNPPEWIVDWIRYAATQGAERVLLYDNGSQDFEGLGEICSRIAEELEVVLISWPFPYGPSRSHYNQFAQGAQLNHASRVLGSCEWQGFLDVDEYPVAPHGLDALLRKQRPWRGLLRVDNYLVPTMKGELTEGVTPRAIDFGHRELRLRGRAHKYFSRPRALHEARTHNGRVRPGYTRGPVSPSKLYFLHFNHLTTDWRGYGSESRLKEWEFNPEQHARCDAVRRVLEELEP